jgi:hypothetical protein
MWTQASREAAAAAKAAKKQATGPAHQSGIRSQVPNLLNVLARAGLGVGAGVVGTIIQASQRQHGRR